MWQHLHIVVGSAMETVAKEDRLGIRLAPGEKALFKRAAELERKSLSEFVLASAREKAESLLAEQNRFTVPAAQMKALCEALDAPPRVIPRLRKLFSEPGILDK
ncbi:MAG: DUF1778 domain-containing protein [Pseudomonadota bacterium]